MSSKIALLATGDEITHGDILNTNSQRIAQLLTDHGLKVGFHMATADIDQDIVQAIHYLLHDHHAIIITGGLGPTSDDRTRFALGQAIEQTLVFDEASWQWIVKRLTSLKLTIPESNKQQALFPQHAVIIDNALGTANGCYVEHQGKLIFMLPGPPAECLPMFHDSVLPSLLNSLDPDTMVQRKWRLFGVSEGHIAAELEEALASYELTTGYRLDFPYIEFKVFTEHHQANEQLWQHIHDLVKPHLLSHDYLPASTVLLTSLTKYQAVITIEDHATGGRLAASILQPTTAHALVFSDLTPAATANLALRISGLNELWQNQLEPGTTNLVLEFIQNGEQETLALTLPYRHERVLKYAIELICHEISKRITS